jgi:tight adherence protein B
MRLAGLAAAVALIVVPTATAAEALRVGTVDTRTYPEVRVSVVTATPLSAPPSILENDRRVVGFTATNLSRAKSLVLAIDRSRSMEGQALADAIAGARSFVAEKAGADRVGIVGFGRRAVRLTGFSSATIDADEALRTLALDSKQGTALYDAVVLGSGALATEPLDGRVLIVLTDGDDVSSKATLEAAASAARRAHVSVYAIGIQSKDFSPAPLEQLAAATGGSYFPATSTAALEQIYAAVADQLQRTWRLSYLTAARPGEQIRVLVSHPTAGRHSKSVRMPGDPGAVAEPGATFALPAFLYEHNVGTVVLSLLTGSCVIFVVGLLLATPRGTRLRRQIEPHTAPPERRRRKGTPRERFAAASGLLLATERWLGHMRFWARVHRLLERADVPLRTVEFLYISAGAGFLLGFVAAVSAMSSFAILGAMVAGSLGPLGYVWFKARRRLQAIDDQLPDLLITIAASLKAGHSFRQALQAVVDEGTPPASSEFKRVLTETSLGRPMDDALREMTDRVGSKNLDFVITAVTIQRQVGGSLAGIFDMVADAVRQRQQFARKIRSLTAMGRMSAYVLIGLPFFIAGSITLLNPEYMDPLYHTSTGHTLIIGMVVMMVFGSLILKKIVSFKG